MLRRNGWWVALLGTVAVAGCSTSYNVATERQESLFMSTQKEVELGEAVAKKVDEQMTPVRDPELLARLDRIGEKLSPVVDRKDITYRFNIVEEKEPNAFALPGGIVYVTTGLLDLVKSDAELAAVLGHEMGHVVAKHAIKRMQGAIGLQLFQVLAAGAGARDAQTLQGIQLAAASVLTAYSQQDELEADRLGVRYLKRAGYQPSAALDALTRLRDYTFKQDARGFSYFRTHPYFSDRLRVVRGEATGQIQFDDYINRRWDGTQ